jgi:hypothetical protein
MGSSSRSNLTCESVARAALGEPVRREGAELLYPCPHPEQHRNGDAHPSFKVNPNKNIWACFVCFAGGTAWQLAAFIARVDPGDKRAVTAWLREHGLLDRTATGNSSRRAAPRGKRVAEVYYGDDLRKVRIALGGNRKSKVFVWEHHDGDGWKPGDGGKTKPLYVNEIFRDADRLDYVVGFEGEAKSDLAGELGIAGFSFKELTEGECKKLQGLRVILWPDMDTSGTIQVEAAARKIHDFGEPRAVAIITPPAELPDGGDIVDAVQILRWGREEIEQLIAEAKTWGPPVVPNVMGTTVTGGATNTADTATTEPNRETDAGNVNVSSGAGAPPEDGAKLLRDLEAFVARFVVLPSNALLPVCLWIMGTYLFDSFETFPYLALLSPEKGCGKTRTTEILELLVSNPVRAVAISEAAMFRLIEAQSPTLIMDEAEPLTGRGERAEALRSLLNAGNRPGAGVPRCVGNSHDLRMFNVYCPKIVCAIRVCPETVRDRSIVVSMQRKLPSESVGRFIRRRVKPEGETLRKRIKIWARGNRAAVTAAYERLNVDFLSDRDLENFEPLLAIMTAADPSRLGELRMAAEALTQQKTRKGVDESLSLRLLADLRAVWLADEPKIFTKTLLERLRRIEESPWAEEVSLTDRKLSEMLGPYEVEPGTVRIGDDTSKGYYRRDIEPAFLRYLAPETSHPSQPA